jgi:protein required for attachment to host cells
LEGSLVGKELGEDKEYNKPLLDDVELQTKYHGREHPSKHPKKGSLTDSHLWCATARTSHQKNEALKNVSLNGRYAGLAIGAVHCELDGWQVSKDCCQICHP